MLDTMDRAASWIRVWSRTFVRLILADASTASRRKASRIIHRMVDVDVQEIRIGKGIEKFIIRQPPKGEKDDYDSENSWISDGLPSSSRRRRRGDGR